VNNFAIAGGTVIGREHSRDGRNSQDAFIMSDRNDLIIGVVCDGCGSEDRSEVGAQLGCRFIEKALRETFVDKGLCRKEEKIAEEIGTYLRLIRDVTIFKIQSIVSHIGPSYFKGRMSDSQTIREYMLFTAVGFCVTPTVFFVFRFGDGVVAVNDTVAVFDSGVKNTPDYLSYYINDREKDRRFDLVSYGKTSDLSSILIGTDGIADFIDSADKTIPGTDDKVGPLSQFWTEDRFFKNQFDVQRRLAMCARSVTRYTDGKQSSTDHGFLTDDTTLIAIRNVTPVIQV